jgi:hypothetical protein
MILEKSLLKMVLNIPNLVLNLNGIDEQFEQIAKQRR